MQQGFFENMLISRFSLVSGAYKCNAGPIKLTPSELYFLVVFRRFGTLTGRRVVKSDDRENFWKSLTWHGNSSSKLFVHWKSFCRPKTDFRGKYQVISCHQQKYPWFWRVLRLAGLRTLKNSTIIRRDNEFFFYIWPLGAPLERSFPPPPPPPPPPPSLFFFFYFTITKKFFYNWFV